MTQGSSNDTEGDALEGGASPRRFAAGDVLDGRYQLERWIGSGGMSEVWSAVHRGLDRSVAIKILRPETSTQSRRLAAEAKALSAIRHPAVVEVWDFGHLPDGAPYLVMELLAGETLLSYLARSGGRLRASIAVDLVTSILDGLTAVHAAGVLHRDIKPENVMIVGAGDGGVGAKLVDFGIAIRDAADSPRVTSAGVIVGTPAYLAPERVLGGSVDAASDIWAVGATFYELLCGRLPFEGNDMPQLMRAILDGPLSYPRDVEPPIDGELFAVLSTALRKDPRQRFKSASEMRDALAAWRERRAQRTTATVELPAQPTSVPAPLAGTPTPLDTLIRNKLRRT